jgi:hypothetical protein
VVKKQGVVESPRSRQLTPEQVAKLRERVERQVEKLRLLLVRAEQGGVDVEHELQPLRPTTRHRLR